MKWPVCVCIVYQNKVVTTVCSATNIYVRFIGPGLFTIIRTHQRKCKQVRVPELHTLLSFVFRRLWIKYTVEQLNIFTAYTWNSYLRYKIEINTQILPDCREVITGDGKMFFVVIVIDFTGATVVTSQSPHVHTFDVKNSPFPEICVSLTCDYNRTRTN